MTYNKEAIRSRAIDYSSQGIVITDPNLPDQPMVDVNKAFEAMTGYDRDELLGRNCRFLQGPDRIQPARKSLRDSIDNLEDKTVVLKNYRKDGTMFWNRLTVSAVYDDDGKLIYFVGVQQDITAQQNQHAYLVKTNEQLDRVEAKLDEREKLIVALKLELANKKA